MCNVCQKGNIVFFSQIVLHDVAGAVFHHVRDAACFREGARVLVDPVSLTYLTGSQIDFVDELIGSQFKVLNPNAAASCGCGTSFSL